MKWPEDAVNWPLTEHSRFVQVGAIRWHVQEAGQGQTLLLIHGAGGASQSWRNLFPILAKSYHVVAMDLPGQGFTQTTARRRFGLDPMTEDLAALCLQEGWSPDAVIGHSAGAAIALNGTSRWSGDAEIPIIGINAALQGFEGIAGWLFPFFAKALAFNPLSARIFSSLGSSENTAKRLLKSTGSDLDETGQKLYHRLISDRDHVAGTLSMMAQWELDPLLRDMFRISAPTLLLTGDRDRTVAPSVSDKAAQRLPRARRIRLSKLGHLAHEEAAIKVAEAILCFLSDRDVNS